MFVSPITDADQDAVQAIADASGLDVDVGAELRRDWTRGWVVRTVADGSSVAFLIAWRVADELQLNHIATRPDVRRRGAGGALLDALIALGRSDRCRVIVLEVRRSNLAAMKLYRSRGFRAIGLRKRYYASDGEDAVEMMLNLDAHGNVETRADEVAIERAP